RARRAPRRSDAPRPGLALSARLLGWMVGGDRRTRPPTAPQSPGYGPLALRAEGLVPAVPATRGARPRADAARVRAPRGVGLHPRRGSSCSRPAPPGRAGDVVVTAPRVSIVVPAHNRAAGLPAVLDALRTELDRYGGAELIVVDSASTDATGAVAAAAAARDPRVRTVRAERPGATRARNLGVAQAQAPLVIFIDDDVLPRPGFLDALAAAHADPVVHAAGGRIVLRFDDAPPS